MLGQYATETRLGLKIRAAWGNVGIEWHLPKHVLVLTQLSRRMSRGLYGLPETWLGLEERGQCLDCMVPSKTWLGLEELAAWDNAWTALPPPPSRKVWFGLEARAA